MHLKSRLLLLFAAALLTGCGNKKPLVSLERDTVVITESVSVVDTVLLRDTVTIEKDRLRVRLLRLPGDTVRVEAECQPDTVRIRQTIIKDNVQELERSRKWVGSLFLLSLVLTIILLLKR